MAKGDKKKPKAPKYDPNAFLQRDSGAMFATRPSTPNVSAPSADDPQAAAPRAESPQLTMAKEEFRAANRVMADRATRPSELRPDEQAGAYSNEAIRQQNEAEARAAANLAAAGGNDGGITRWSKPPEDTATNDGGITRWSKPPEDTATNDGDVTRWSSPPPETFVEDGRITQWSTSDPVEAILTTTTANRALSMLPFSMRSMREKQEFVMAEYPNVARAAFEAGASKAEVEDAINFTLAVDAATRITGAFSDERKRQIMGTMEPFQQALVLDIIQAAADEAESRKVGATPNRLDAEFDRNRETGSLPLQVGAKVWEYTLGPALDGLLWANEQAIHGTRSLMLLQQYGSDAWEMSERGTFDPESIAMWREVYGKYPDGNKAVDIILELKKAQTSGDDDPIGTTLDKFGDDPQARRIMDALFNGVNTEEWIHELATAIDASDLGNIGNLAAWSIVNAARGPEWADISGNTGPMTPEEYNEVAQSMWFTGLSRASDIASTVLLDPTLGASRIKNAYTVLRYGVGKYGKDSLSVARVSEAMEKSGSVNFWNGLGANLDKVRDLENAGDTLGAAQMMNSLVAQNKRWFGADKSAMNAMVMLKQAGVRDIDTAKAFFADGDNVQLLLMGQTAKRGWEFTVPHMTAPMMAAKAVALKARGLNPSNIGARAYVASIIGDETASLMPDEAAAAVARRFLDDPQRAGQSASDFVFDAVDGSGVRTISGRIVDTLPGVRDPGNVRWRDKYGWARKGFLTGDIGAVADRIGRLMARRPEAGALDISSGKDAGTVKQLAQAAGMRRYFANYLAYVWTHATPEIRMNIVEGLEKTRVYASGVHLTNPTLADELVKQASASTRGTTAYTADQRNVIAERALAEIELQQSNPELFANNYADEIDLATVLRRQANDEGRANLRQVKEQLTAARAERKNIKGLREIEEAGDTGFTQSFDDWVADDAEIVRLQDQLENLLLGEYDQAAFDAVESAIQARRAVLESAYMREALKDPAIRQSLGVTDDVAAQVDQVIPDTIPADLRTQWADEFNLIPEQQLVGSGLAVSEVGGATASQQIFEPILKTAADRKNWDRYGAVSGARIKNMVDEWGEEEFWAWWNWGNNEVHLHPEFLNRTGRWPGMRPDPGKGLPAERVKAQLPGEIRGTAIDVPAGRGKTVTHYRVPWKGTAEEREYYIQSRWAEWNTPAEGSSGMPNMAEIQGAVEARRMAADDAIMARAEQAGVVDNVNLSAAPLIEVEARIKELELQLNIIRGALGSQNNMYRERLAELKRLSKQRRSEIKREVRQAVTDRVRLAWDDMAITNPSVVDGRAYALRDTQLASQVSTLDQTVLDLWSARSGYWTALLGNNAGISKATDFWVLATLGGPRFIGRSGIEDFGLYAYTDGSLTAFRKGQKAMSAYREATLRPVADTLAPKAPRSRKVGLMRTATNKAIDRLHPALRGWIEPNLSADELVEVNRLINLPPGERDMRALANLFAVALQRKGLGRIKDDRWAGIVKGERRTPDEIRDQEWLKQAVEYGHLGDGYADVAETARHLADARPPVAGVDESMLVNGSVMRRVAGGETFGTAFAPSRDVNDLKDFYRELTETLHGDGMKGYRAFTLSQRWYYAKLEFYKTGNRSKMDEVLDEYTAVVADDEQVRAGMYVLANENAGGVRAFAERKLDDVLRMMTTKNGMYNRKLRERLAYTKIDETTGEEYTLYGVYRTVDGEREYVLYTDDLIKDEIPVPQSIRVTGGLDIVTSDKLPLTSRAWNTMGEALARLTREPIFTANYLDSRRLMAGWESEYAARVGAEAAAKHVSEIAMQRAYRMTMDYVDDPNIRSQLAWQLRNVARFYRATEDFNRRMVRVASNKPETIWKLALTYDVLDDSGFVWEDEYGDKYFIFPVIGPVFQTLNGALANLFGVDMKVPELPISFGAKVSMITPSADPNAWIPTLSGPWTGIGLKSIVRGLPMLRSLEDDLFGPYSKSQGIVESWVTAAAGPNFSNAIQSVLATIPNKDELSDTLFAGAAKQATVAVTAAGIYDPTKEYQAHELDDIRHVIDVTAMNMVFLKMVMYPILPVSTYSFNDDTSDFAKRLGFDSMNAVYLDYVAKYDGDPGRALVEFTKDNPGKAIWTLSKYKAADGAGRYPQTVEAMEFMEEHSDLVNKYKVGMAYFTPQVGTPGGLPAFQFQMDNGLRTPRSAKEFWVDATTTVGYQLYKQLRDNYKTALDAATTPEQKRDLEARYANGRNEIYRAYPGTESRVEGSADLTANMSPSEYRSDVEQVRGALAELRQKGVEPQDGKLFDGLLQLYDQTRAQKDRIVPGSANDDKAVRDINTKWRNVISEWTGLSDNEMYDNFLFILSRALDVAE